MAAQDPGSVPAHSAQVVGNAFVEQYYQVLHQSPAHVFKFYQEVSFLSRPDSNGNMTSVTTMQAINDKILSLNYEACTVEIETADAQDSYNGGVIVLVTGCLTEKGSARRKFTQTFFLAPQDPGYYVLNDVFRYVEDKKPHEPHHVTEKAISIPESTLPAAAAPYTEPIHVPDNHTLEPTPYKEDINNVGEVLDPPGNDGASIEQEEVVNPPVETISMDTPLVTESAPVPQGDAPKVSYASIVKVARANSKTNPVYVATNIVKAPAPVVDRQLPGSAKPAPQPDAAVPGSENAIENNNAPEEAEGYSIYVRNLPLAATVELVQEEFKRFGAIKHDGVQVRTNKGFVFGFVEFESQSSMLSALEASPIFIGDRKSVVEEKRTTTRVGNGRARPNSSGRGGYRGEGFRGRGNYGGGRGYGRSDFRSSGGEFSGRSRGQGGRGGGRDGYQWVNQSEAAGRGGRQSGATPA